MTAREEFSPFLSCGGVAQLVERGSHKPYVVGSTPTAATIFSRGSDWNPFAFSATVPDIVPVSFRAAS
jgi:hypothetical protein